MADDDLLDEQYDPASAPEEAAPWLNLLDDAEQKFRPWQDKADSISDLYASLDRQAGATRSREFAMFWANIGVLAPSVYARPPVPVVVPQFKDRDPVKVATSEMLERSLVKSYDLTGIDGVMRLCRDDMLIVGRGVMWVRYEDKGTVADDAATQTTGERAIIEHLNRRDFRHDPARTWPEVDWVARCGWLNRKDARARFGEAALGAGYVERGEGGRMGMPDEGSSPEEKAPFWEIWHRGLGKVVWVTEGVEEVLDQGPPHLKLEGFFPCPRPAYATVEPGTLVPVPDYVYYKDQLEEINKLTARIHALSDAVQVKGFYPGGGEIGEAVEAALNLNDDRRIMVPVSNFAAFGGSGDPIVWLPIDMIATTIAGLIEMRRQIIDDVYQIVGLSDIMRGSTEAQETLGAQQLKSQYGSIRIRDKQHELVRVARDATRIVAEVMAEEFSRETLLALSQMRMPTDAEIQKQVRAIEMQVRQGAEQVQQQMQMLQMQAVQSQLQGPPAPGPPAAETPQGPGGPPLQPPGAAGPPGAPPEAPESPQEDQGPGIEEQVEQLKQQAQQALQAAQSQVQELQAQATVEDCIGLLRNERLRPFALDIETDSTIQPDEDAEKQRRAEFLQVFGGLMQQLAALVEVRPEAAAFAGEVLKFGLAPYRVGRDLDSAIDKFVEQLEQSASGEKPPSPEEIKAQAEAQKLMAEMSMKAEEAKLKAATEERKMQYDWQMERMKIEADREKMLGEMKIKERESQQKMLLEQQKHQQDMQKAQVEFAKMQKEMEATDAKIAAQREDMQLRRQGAEQDFAIKSKVADHGMGLAERQASLKTAFNGGSRLMGIPVVQAANGYGIPVTIAANGYGLPVEVAANGYGTPVVLVASGGMPVVGTFGPDVTAPLAVSFSPTDNSTGVNTATLLIVTFDSIVTLGTGNVTLKKTSDNSTVEAWNVVTEAGTGAGQVSVEFSTQLTMRLTTSIAGGTEYYVIWDANVVKDLSNNPVAAQASTTLWSFTTAGTSYDAATEAIAAAFTTPPTTSRKNLIDAAVVALKAAGVWAKLDALYLFAAADSQAAKINWVAPGTFNCTEVNSPTFTADRGFNGNGSTNYLDSGFVPSTAPSPKFTLNSASIFGWCVTEQIATSMVGPIASPNIGGFWPRFTGGVLFGRLNSSSNIDGTAIGSSIGLTSVTRNVNAVETYRDAASHNAGAFAPSAVPTTALGILTGDWVSGFVGTCANAGWGGFLSAADNTALYNALRTYLTGVGVP